MMQFETTLGFKREDGLSVKPGDLRLVSMSPQARANQRMRINAMRLDAVSPGRGLFLARQLEHMYNEVLRTEYAPKNAFDLFELDNRVPVGAATHTVRRIDHLGSARYHRGDSNDQPTVDVEQDEESFPVHPIVTGIQMDIFEMQAADFANFNLQAELELAAEETIMQFANDKTFTGDEDRRALGIFNYPYLPKDAAAIPFNNSQTADAILAEMHRLANFAAQRSKGKMAPDTWIMSIALRDYLSTRKRSATTDQTILQAFLQDNRYITEVVGIFEMSEAAPGGLDYALLYKRGDLRSVANVVPQGFTMLPIQEQGFKLVIPCYMLHGGVVMRDGLKNLLITIAR